MAALVDADVTYSLIENDKIEGNRKFANWSISFGDGVKTYPAGGIPLNKAKLDCPVRLDFFGFDDMSSSDGLLYKHDYLNNKIRIYQFASQAVAPGPAGSPSLGTSGGFEILANTAVTNTGSTIVTGDIGISPGSAITGFPPGLVIGATHQTDAAAAKGQVDFQAAYTDLHARTATPITANLNGQTLTAGVYTESSSTFVLAGSGNATLTLSGSATDIFVFIPTSSMTFGAGGTPTIALTGGALASNVYWVPTVSATLNVSATGTMVGTVIANTSITLNGGAVNGRLIALNGAVTIAAASTVSLASAPVTPAGMVELTGAVPAKTITALAVGY